jgi:hypothetical protein
MCFSLWCVCWTPQNARSTDKKKLFCLLALLIIGCVQQNHLLVKFQGGVHSFVISYRLCCRKKCGTVRPPPYIHIYASNHKPEINDTFQLTFHLNPSFLQYILFCFSHYNIKGGGESVVCITTRYELDGPWIESRWGGVFPHPFRPDLGPTRLPAKWVRGVFPISKAAVAWRRSSTPI